MYDCTVRIIVIIKKYKKQGHKDTKPFKKISNGEIVCSARNKERYRKFAGWLILADPL
jgi:hypothetical protein